MKKPSIILIFLAFGSNLFSQSKDSTVTEYYKNKSVHSIFEYNEDKVSKVTYYWKNGNLQKTYEPEFDSKKRLIGLILRDQI